LTKKIPCNSHSIWSLWFFGYILAVFANFKAVSSGAWNPWQMGREATDIRCQ